MSEPKHLVLMTGSSGRIGSALIERLCDRCEIVALDQPGPPHPKPRAHCIAADLESEDSVREALRQVRARFGERISSVFHLAGYYSFSGDPDPRYTTINVQGTARLLRALQGFDVEQFVFSSTMLVHAPTSPGQPIREDSLLEAKWAYPKSKLDAEHQVRSEHGKIPYVILRLAGVYSEEGELPALAQQIARISERRLTSHVFPGDLRHGQSSIHLYDLVDLFELLVERRADLPQDLVLLAGEPQPPSYGELQAELGRLLHGMPWHTREVPKTLAQAGAWLQEVALPESKEPFIKHWMIDMADDHYELDIGRGRTLLGWQPRHRLLDELPQIVAKLQHDPQAWYAANHIQPAAESEPLPIPCEESPQNEHVSAAQVTETRTAEARCGQHMTAGARCGAAMAGAERTSLPSSAGATTEPSDHDMLLAMHHGMLWPHYANVALGLWLITSPFVLGYLSTFVADPNVLRTFQERGLQSPDTHNLWMAWNDILTGLLVVVLGLLSADPKRRFSWSQWAIAAVGAWLLFAPLLFWTPLPEAYANDTLIGALLIAFSVLVPMMPGMSMAGMMGGPDIPPGWSYTPSSFVQRFPIASLALFGFFISRYLTAYQLGHIDGVWEPFFLGQQGKNGTEHIITSDMSTAWPVADAGVGAVAYAFEVLMAVMGDKRRWRTMPWMVLAFGVLVVPLGGVSIFFIVVQPIVIGAWCFLCLVAALAMAIMIPYSLDELVASGQFLLDAHRRGKSFWRSFWMGDAMEGGCEDRSKGFAGEPRQIVRDMLQEGVTWPWTLLVSIGLGVLLMFTRLLFDSSSAMANSDHLVGALVVTFTIMAAAEVGRAIRFINIPFGVWLIVAPWVLEGVTTPIAAWSGVLIGVLLIVLAIPRGPIRNRYGTWDRFIV